MIKFKIIIITILFLILIFSSSYLVIIVILSISQIFLLKSQHRKTRDNIQKFSKIKPETEIKKTRSFGICVEDTIKSIPTCTAINGNTAMPMIIIKHRVMRIRVKL